MSIYGLSGREVAEKVARDLAGAAGDCPVPPHWPLWPWTSAERRWSQLTRVKMRRRAPHPRPWEGPLVDFFGVFRGVDRELRGTLIP